MENDDNIEIDLRRYIEILLRYWQWIFGAAVTVGLAALIWSLLQPHIYEAVALTAITKSPYTLSFDPRFTTVADTIQAYKAYPELAKSDDVLQSVYVKLDPRPKALVTVDDLNKVLTAQSGTDPSIIRLRAQAQSPADAARIANIWAEVFIARANEVYGTQGETQVQFFDAQVASADKELQGAEQAIIDYQAHDRSTILQNQLDSIKKKQVDYLADQRSVSYLLQDIARLREQLSKQPAASPSGLADRLTALFLQIKAYKAQADVPIQLQFSNPDAVASASVGEQIAFLDGLSSSMKVQLTGTDGLLKELEPQILTLQQQLQQISAEVDRLTRTRDVARQTSMTLAQKAVETRVAVQSNKGGAQLASHAAVPEAPLSSRTLTSTALGGVAGLALGIIAVFIIEWRRKGVITRQKIQEAGVVGR
jgi:uncharacterized protein involved in exopolysaccharide biosynthesis